MGELDFTSKKFVYAIDNLNFVMPKFGNFSDKFANFNFLVIKQYHVIYVNPDTPDICLDTPHMCLDIRTATRIL